MKEYCRVSIDENNYQSGLWNCTCEMQQQLSKQLGNPYWKDAKCDGCICNSDEYFEEDIGE